MSFLNAIQQTIQSAVSQIPDLNLAQRTSTAIQGIRDNFVRATRDIASDYRYFYSGVWRNGASIGQRALGSGLELTTYAGAAAGAGLAIYAAATTAAGAGIAKGLAAGALLFGLSDCGAKTGLEVPPLGSTIDDNMLCRDRNDVPPTSLIHNGYNLNLDNVEARLIFIDRAWDETGFIVERGIGISTPTNIDCSHATDYQVERHLPAQAGFDTLVRFALPIPTDLPRNQASCIRVRAVYEEGCISPASNVEGAAAWR